MCGIALCVGRPTAVRDVESMCEGMYERGPDDGGSYSTSFGPTAQVALGNRRLAICDLSSAGHQPMRSQSGPITIAYNGMLFNYRELRRELAVSGVALRTNCDTEVVLEGIAHHGVSFVGRLRGMFAFVILDERDHSVLLARDPFGIKPLYYSEPGPHELVAASTLSVLRPIIDSTCSAKAIVGYLEWGFVPEPLTTDDGIRAFPPGTTARYADGVLSDPVPFWSPPTPGPRRQRSPSQAIAATELRQFLGHTVKLHLEGDQPVAVFLSGGIDSSVLAAHAIAAGKGEVLTFSLVFDEPGFSDSQRSRTVAKYLGTRHTEVTLDKTAFIKLAGEAIEAMDQPSMDAVNTFIISKLAAEHGLKVALSGLGADELFDGYAQRSRAARLRAVKRSKVPKRVLRCLPIPRWDKVEAYLDGLYPDEHAALRGLYAPSNVARLLAQQVHAVGIQDVAWAGEGRAADRLSRRDIARYTKNMLLRDSDSMSMANSLELRVPFLDARLVEFVYGLPARIRARPNKALLRESASGMLPSSALLAPKHGFLLPIEAWLTDVIEEDRQAFQSGLNLCGISLAAADDVLREHTAGERSWHEAWALYALAKWALKVQGGDTSCEYFRS